ncbi:MAG: PIG-L family deacetylase [Chloroflexi bacterium]|nr:PIG-L family deacetylase [Chloroflexota bacterium]
MSDNHTVPASALVIIAHPDDAEFTMAGTVAAWVRAGCQVTYVLCTDGNVGYHGADLTREQLAALRRTEQRAACAALGVHDVVFLGHDDCTLQPSIELRRELVQVIRDRKPEAVLTGDPTELFFGDSYVNHPDHRAAAQAAIDAVAPAAGVPLLWPETGPAHQVQRLYIHGNRQPNLWVDIAATLEQKIEALRQHASQLAHDPAEMIRAWAAEEAKEHGLDYCESYRVITL